VWGPLPGALDSLEASSLYVERRGQIGGSKIPRIFAHWVKARWFAKTLALATFCFPALAQSVPPLPIPQVGKLLFLPTLWQWAAPEGSTISKCVLEKEVVICELSGPTHSLQALRVTDGEPVWNIPLPEREGLPNSKLEMVGNVGLQNTDATLMAFDPRSGRIRWSKVLSQGERVALVNPLVLVSDLSEDSAPGQPELVSFLEASTGEMRGQVFVPGEVDLCFSWLDGILVHTWTVEGAELGFIGGGNWRSRWRVRVPGLVRLEVLPSGAWVKRCLNGLADCGHWFPLHVDGTLGPEVELGGDEFLPKWASKGFELWEGYYSRQRLCKRSGEQGKYAWCYELPQYSFPIAAPHDRGIAVAFSTTQTDFLLVLDGEGRVVEGFHGVLGTSAFWQVPGGWLFQTARRVLLKGLQPVPQAALPERWRTALELLREANAWPCCDEVSKQRSAQLEASLYRLGSDIGPLLAERLPGLGPVALLASAKVLASWRKEKATAYLLEWIKKEVARPQSLVRDSEFFSQLLVALQQLGLTDSMGDVLLRVAEHPAADPWVALTASGCVASIGNSELLEHLETLVAKRLRKFPRGKCFRPEPPRVLAQLLAPDREVDSHLVDEIFRVCREGTCPAPGFDSKILDQRGARRVAHEGQEYLLFFSSFAGGAHDLWLTRLQGEALQAPRFTGLSVPVFDAHEGRARFRVEITSESLAICPLEGADNSGGETERTSENSESWQEAANGAPCTAVSWLELGKDTDGDGLTDLLERRLGLKPDARDSDGDGIYDGDDWCANCNSRAATVEDVAVKALLKEFFVFLPLNVPAIVVWPRHLEFEVPGSAVIVLTEKELLEFGTRAGPLGMPRITVRQKTGGTGASSMENNSFPWPEDLVAGARELAFELVVETDTFGTVYGAVVRETSPGTFWVTKVRVLGITLRMD